MTTQYSAFWTNCQFRCLFYSPKTSFYSPHIAYY